MKSNPFTITTSQARVFLRLPKPEDIPVIYKLVRDPKVLRYTLVPYPYFKRHAVDFVEMSSRSLKERSAYIFVIIEKESNQMVGAVGLHLVTQVHKKAELGYWMGKPFRGMGYTTEASRMLIEYGFKNLKLERIYAYAMTDNPDSQRVLKKCGFLKEGLLRHHIKRQGRWRDLYAYAILKSEWKKIKRSKP